MKKQKVNRKFYKSILIFEGALLIAFIFNIFSAFPDNSKENLKVEEEVFSEVTIGKCINVEIENKKNDLLIMDRFVELTDVSKLRLLKKGDVVFTTTRKNRTFQEWINYFFGHQEIYGLRSTRNGIILDFDAYLEAERGTGVFVFKLLGVIVFSSLCLAIIYSWILSIQYFLNPKENSNLINHPLVKYKVKQGKNANLP